MFEHHTQPLLSPGQFLARMARSGALSLGVLVLTLAAGMLGYHRLEGLGWLDAFLNASMLLGGMGPVTPPVTDGGKLFAGLYAMFCGLIIIVLTGILLTPVLHRLLHVFHHKRSER